MYDTITALSTPPGISGIAVVRLSGKDAIPIADKLFSGKVKIKNCQSHTIHFGKFISEGRIIDTVTVSIFKEPNSYTGEDVIEIGCHGGLLVYQEIIDALINNGARLAEPGEFTKRAFLNGKLDLTQVEAVGDLIHSMSVPGSQISARQLNGEFTSRINYFRKQLLNVASMLELELDFADEEMEFIDKENIHEMLIKSRSECKELSESFKSSQILRSGYYVGIAGFPNSGKSTLFNALLKKQRAIVSEIPGTTRDYLEEVIYLNGIPVKLIDTAGLRETSDIIEIEGIKMMESVLEESNLILVLNDVSISRSNSDNLTEELKKKFPDTKIFLVQNKIDKVENIYDNSNQNEIFISAKNLSGIETLKNIIEQNAKSAIETVKDVLINQRQAELFRQATQFLDNAIEALEQNRENEIISFEIRNASKTIGEVTGENWNEEVLNNIFSKFCIGK